MSKSIGTRGHESSSHDKPRLNISFVITRFVSLIYFRILTLDHVDVGWESKGNIEVDQVSKYNYLTFESGLLNDWVWGATDKVTWSQLRNNQDAVSSDKA